MKLTEVVLEPMEDNIYLFPTGRQLDNQEVEALLELEKWEQVLSEW